jgi:hypothetical protein
MTVPSPLSTNWRTVAAVAASENVLEGQVSEPKSDNTFQRYAGPFLEPIQFQIYAFLFVEKVLPICI